MFSGAPPTEDCLSQLIFPGGHPGGVWVQNNRRIKKRGSTLRPYITPVGCTQGDTSPTKIQNHEFLFLHKIFRHLICLVVGELGGRVFAEIRGRDWRRAAHAAFERELAAAVESMPRPPNWVNLQRSAASQGHGHAAEQVPSMRMSTPSGRSATT